MKPRRRTRPRAAAPKRKERRKGKHYATRPKTLRRHSDPTRKARRAPGLGTVDPDAWQQAVAEAGTIAVEDESPEKDEPATLRVLEYGTEEDDEATGDVARIDAAIVEQDDAPPPPRRRASDWARVRWSLVLPSWNERPSRDHLLVLDGPAPLVEEASLRVQATRTWFPQWLVRKRPRWTPARRKRAVEAAVWVMLLSEYRGVLAYSGPNLDSTGHTPSRLSYDDLHALASAGGDALEKAIAEEARGRRRRQPRRGLLAKAIRECRHHPPLAGRALVAQVAAFLHAPHRAVAEATQTHRAFRRQTEPLLADPTVRKRLVV